MLIFCTSLVCIVISANPFIRCGHLAHQEELYFLLLSTVIDLSKGIISLLNFGKCGNSFLRITDAVSAYVTVYEQLRSFLDRL